MSDKSDIIRAFLPGLPPEITDVTIDIVIANSATMDEALLTLCDSAASVAVAASSGEDIKLGSLGISSSSSKDAEHWLAIKDNFLKRKMIDGQIIIDPTDSEGVVGYGMVLTGADIPRETWEGQYTNPARSNPE